jgi:nucleoside-diphosphate-sugar epimerase
VVVTGATGFLGAHTVLKFFEDGGFRVRGTVRSKTNAAKIDPLKKTLGDYFDQLELVEADLLDKDSMVAACAGADFLAHTASPFYLNVSKEEKEKIIKPAVDGTVFALEGAKAAGMKRVVITSSLAVVQCPATEDEPADGVWKEEHWSNPDRPQGMHPYLESKTVAERAAWKFVDDLPDGEKIDLITIQPCFILGPAYQTEAFTSGEIFSKTLTGATDPVPHGYMGIVDVRDVAQAHVLSIKVDAAKGHRVFTWNGSHSRISINKILHEKFAGDGWPICINEGPETDAKPSKIDVSPSTDILGLKYTDAADTFISMAQSMIDSGFVKKPE